MPTIKIPINSRKYPGLYALIDEADYELVSQYQWSVIRPENSRTFYAGRWDSQQRGPRGGARKLIFMHREINQTPDGLDTDHINGNGLDNRKKNLRSVGRSQNMANSHTPITTKTGYLGVAFDDRQRKPYIAIVRGRNYGRFETPDEAARTVDKHRRIIWGEHVKLNFPEERPPLEETRRLLRKKASRRHTSRFRGVHFSKGAGKWVASITHKEQFFLLGRFESEIEAAAAYDRARVKFGLSPVNTKRVDASQA